MKVKALVWMGIKTEKFAEVELFLQNVMDLPLTYRGHDFTLFQLPSGDKVEIFSPDETNQHFAPDSIACGFLVEDIYQASQELVQAGIELIGPVHDDRPDGYAWQHFRGPDGNLYELVYDPERS
ncbi:VOC family protein [Ktedonosporobacter rubrisoli]|uniref:VOC family protein n=1 Tax=Ktedonosporobacter rubrisoli TaxID=2509675 RepID=A0A4P6K4A5_KTERU|nr:VOC family protein [Ktedonosporobacter rubrisoli]QBD82885.1 VOC family protein [Ktedonosporobacter rubrisoli]